MRTKTASLPSLARRRMLARRMAGAAAALLALLLVLDLTVLRLDRRARWMSKLPPPVLQGLAWAAPGDPAILYGLGRQYAQHGDFKRSGEALKRVSDRHPDFWLAKSAYAYTLVELDDEHDAYLAAQNCQAADASSADVALAMVASGRLHLRRGESEEARQQAELAIQAERDIPEAWLLRAEALTADETWDEAETAASRVTQARPTSAEAWALRAKAAYHTGKPDAGIQYAEAALKLEAANQPALLCLSQSLLARGRADDLPRAESTLEQALQRNPTDPEALAAQGELRLRQGRTAEGVEQLKGVLAVRPELNHVRVQLASALQGDAPAEAARWRAEAAKWDGWLAQERTLREKMNAEHNKSRTRFALARLYFQMGLWKKGRREVIFGLQPGPDPEGLALRKEYQRHEAAAKAASSGPKNP